MLPMGMGMGMSLQGEDKCNAISTWWAWQGHRTVGEARSQNSLKRSRKNTRVSESRGYYNKSHSRIWLWFHPAMVQAGTLGALRRKGSTKEGFLGECAIQSCGAWSSHPGLLRCKCWKPRLLLAHAQVGRCPEKCLFLPLGIYSWEATVRTRTKRWADA